MKNALIGILAAIAIALGALALRQHSYIAEQQTKVTAAEQALAEAKITTASHDQEVATLRQKLETAQQQSAVNAGAAAQLSLQLTNHIDEVVAEVRSNAKPANPLTEMFKNPEMRDMIKQQQKTVLESMIDKNYRDLFNGMQLTPEQAAQLKDLISKKMSVGADIGMEMMSGELTAAERQDLMQRAKESTDAVADEIKEFLGPEAYATYESYEKTIQDRMAVSAFKDQLPGGDMALTTAQEQSLIQAIGEERQGFKFTTDFSNQNDFSQDMFSKFNEANINTYFAEQDNLHQRYLARAKEILSPDQYAAYEKSLKAQQEMTKMGMKMAASMFGNSSQ